MAEEVVIEPRFRGPPESANGGYTCGLLARFLDPLAAEVTLRLPPPLERRLRVDRAPGRAALMDGDALVAEAAPGDELELDLPRPPSVEAAREARQRSPLHGWHPFPACFVCGPQRDAGDGLRLTCGPVPGADVVAAPWDVDESLPHDDGGVLPELMWAALDCPSGLAPYLVADDRPGTSVLGRLTARVLGRARVGETYLALGWALERDGRKSHTASAVMTPAGEALGYARATWIELATG